MLNTENLLYIDFKVVFKVKDCKLKCLLNSSVLLNNFLLVLCQSVLLKCTVKSSQTENIKNIIILNTHKYSSNQSKHLKTDRQEQKTICSHVSDKNLQNERDIHYDMLDEQISEKQALKNVSMSLNEDITESCISDISLTIEQDEKQFSIFSNTVSTITSINHTTITMINKASEKDTATYIVKL